MKREFVTLCTALLLLIVPAAHASGTSDPWNAIAKKVRESILPVESERGSCTGFVTNSDVKGKGELDYVQTAAHCDGKSLYADSMPAKVVWKDTHYDLMILEVADTGRPALQLAKDNPGVGDEIASYGYGYALSRPMFRTAHISDDAADVPEVDGGPFLMIDASFVEGQSGGPCINPAGEVVMIVQQGNDKIGLGVGAERMKDKAGRYYEKPKPPKP